MAPYKVAMLQSVTGTRLDLIVPVDGQSTFSDLVQIVINRAAKHSFSFTDPTQVALRLGSETGFLIDPEDRVADILTLSDILFIVEGIAESRGFQENKPLPPSVGVKIRVITPVGAQRHLEARHLPLLKSGQTFPLSTTLANLRKDIAAHLGLPAYQLLSPTRSECNCVLADELLAQGVWSRFQCSGHLSSQCHILDTNNLPLQGYCAKCSSPISAHPPTSNDAAGCGSYILVRKEFSCGHMVHSSCIGGPQGSVVCSATCVNSPHPPEEALEIRIVYGHSRCEWLSIGDPTGGAIMKALRLKFGDDFVESSAIHMKGGVQKDTSDKFDTLPVVSICAASRHDKALSKSRALTLEQTTGPLPSSIQLDLHTIEGPIETSRNDLTLADAMLPDLVVEGVLSIFVVEWRAESQFHAISGQDGIFAASCWWRLPVVQSDRGMAAALSCLRVFAHLAGDEEFEEFHHNEILRLIHLLTRFPPAVRAFHILISGKTLRPSECAAIIQSLAATLQELVPKPLIDHDGRRVLEGTRLLLGLVLHRMRRKPSSKPDNSAPLSAPTPLPWIEAFHTVDLQDCKTVEPVIDPIQTVLGLMEKSAHEGLKNGGILGYNPCEGIEVSDCPDNQALRVALLYGGCSDEVSFYDADTLTRAYLATAATETLGSEMKGLSKDLQYLAVLCEETKLSVISPRQLSSAEAPCLTLDRDGHLAVYTGKAACAPPDKDKAVYHPLTGTEEQIDVNVVAQMLEPIIKSREKDGTAVFDLFSTSFRRKDAVPSELLVVAVDISHSMKHSSDFVDVSDDDEIVMASTSKDDVFVQDPKDEPITYPEVREFITSHSSYQDMLAIVNTASTNGLRATALDVIAFLRELIQRHIAHFANIERSNKTWATSAFAYPRGCLFKQRMDELTRMLSGLYRYERALCDLLIFHAKDPDFQPQPFTWSHGMEVPLVQRPPESAKVVDLSEICVVPNDYICPIKQAGVFQDPVMTSDNLGPYERHSIRRWYRRNNTSPLSGLPIMDKGLKRNQPLADSIKKWVEGEDIISSVPSTPKRTQSQATNRIALNFTAPNGTFTRTLPHLLTMASLYSIAFRGMRGVYQKFGLYTEGSLLPCTTEILTQRSLRTGQDIFISVEQPSEDNVTTQAGFGNQEMCLVKVYTRAVYSAKADFCYWVPRNTPVTLASLLFRNWRFHQHSWGKFALDCDVWTNLSYSGDHSLEGQPHQSWDMLNVHLEKLIRSDLLQDEDLCHRPQKNLIAIDNGDLDRNEEVTPKYDRYRVLKAALLSHRSPESEEKRKLERLRTLTRLGVTKSIFSAFINRIIAYNYSTTVGLVVFGTQATVSQTLTDVIENFRTAVERMEPDGDTALWDSLALAGEQLIAFEKKFPGVKKRILCLSDGTDTNSSKTAAEVSHLLLQNKIVVDSCSIGDEDNAELRTVSYLTGGYKFVPKTLEEAVAICELEPVLSQDERPPIQLPLTPAFLTRARFAMATKHATVDAVTRDVYPQHKTHPNLSDTFVRIGTLAKSTVVTNSSVGDTQSSSNVRIRRILNEIRDVAMRPHPSCDVYVSEQDMSFWKVVLVGPSGSAYARGTFVMYLHMDDAYPRRAPKGRFITRIFHPNINKGGRVCHSLFDRNWTVDTSNKQILDTVFGLMLVPEFTDPVNTVVTLNYYWDEVAFKGEVEKSIEKYAKKSRDELGKEIMGETD